jgi:hypothetical protein
MGEPKSDFSKMKGFETIRLEGAYDEHGVSWPDGLPKNADPKAGVVEEWND